MKGLQTANVSYLMVLYPEYEVWAVDDPAHGDAGEQQLTSVSRSADGAVTSPAQIIVM